ncbi:MAG: histidinol-phosphate transaminase [Lachnospiraceae bacterium]|nr:histidinol-phosphate transaminase [Lachnospiraceae bacterium]
MRELKDKIRQIAPYVPGEQPKERDIIKLNTNECPYLPSPQLIKALREFHGENLRLYSDPEAEDLTKALSEVYGVPQDQIFVGVGSDEVLALSFQTFFAELKDGEHLLFPDVTYSFYPGWADVYGIPYETQPLDENFRMVAADYKKENGGIIFPNPNAPTGVEEPLSLVEEIIRANPDSVVMVDEAYVDFGGESALPLVDKYENLLVIRTYSKSRALAGLRVGFAIGNPKLIKYLNDVKFSVNSYTMNMPSLLLGREAVLDDAYFKDTLAKVIKTREWMKTELKRLGFSFPDSKSNFVFATHKDKSAEEIFQYLRSKQIFVRYFKLPRIDNYLRISVGTDEEAKILIEALEELLG